MPTGARFTGERHTSIDGRTGVEVVRFTSADAIHHTLYFTKPSVTADGERFVFVSDRDGGWNLFAASLDADEIVQLTEGGDLNPFSAVNSPDGTRVYFTAGNQVRSVRLDTLRVSVLADFGDASLGGCSLDASGAQIVTVVRRGGSSELATVRTDGMGYSVFYEPPREVGYVQFCPADSGCVLYSSGIDQRMWTATTRGIKDRPLYLHDTSQWITHESWLGQSDTVIFTRWGYGLLAIDRNGGTARTITRQNAWHASSRRDGGMIVADTVLPDMGLLLIDPTDGRTTVLCHPEATSQGTRWGYDTPEAGTVTAETYGPQWTHPHPAFSPDGRWVSFTSDRTGSAQVYLARVPDSVG